MGKINRLLKKGLQWYFAKYAECYDERYYRYPYRVY